jgi:enoyl-CoA hydratase/carnithine racemase
MAQELMASLFEKIHRLRQPVIAAVNGAAVGGGFALALLSDIRIAASEARFGFPQVHRGIPPSYAAARAVLPPAVALELCLTGRLIDADEAHSIGLVGELVPAESLLERSQDLARGLAPPAISSQVKALARAEAQQSWLRLLDREKREFLAAVLGE